MQFVKKIFDMKLKNFFNKNYIDNGIFMYYLKLGYNFALSKLVSIKVI